LIARLLDRLEPRELVLHGLGGVADLREREREGEGEREGEREGEKEGMSERGREKEIERVGGRGREGGNLSLYMHTYIIYTLYIYIEREREGEREGDSIKSGAPYVSIGGERLDLSLLYIYIYGYLYIYI
jgi:hypothetical protein